MVLSGIIGDKAVTVVSDPYPLKGLPPPRLLQETQPENPSIDEVRKCQETRIHKLKGIQTLPRQSKQISLLFESRIREVNLQDGVRHHNKFTA